MQRKALTSPKTALAQTPESVRVAAGQFPHSTTNPWLVRSGTKSNSQSLLPVVGMHAHRGTCTPLSSVAHTRYRLALHKMRVSPGSRQFNIVGASDGLVVGEVVGFVEGTKVGAVVGESVGPFVGF